ncbi:Gfo/Idh/MocA family oxidoreductase [Skermanella sp. TT6]|uniref:Gfo/Idh/MocA family oxidoreductase n=1 Tax=Skermanella cutis TaxID=2775420 RepID=A0ABX7AZT8_9PROT|nr:Gfo/Idh/MocA family oxidoreductase [Skermanella sp. TT6]QQP87423.1 Gfo/Idh/MocA family oxidoreductase [Skermanella sp. TT6]
MTIEGRQGGASKRRLRLGMVGGGRGAFIGAVHRIAARLDDRWELVAGALSSDPQRARDSAADLHIAADRAYSDFCEMARAEAWRPDGIDAVAIVTPNHLHHPAARAFLDAGIHVICDKPMTATVAQAEDLAAAVEASGRLFALTHNYTGYPMVRHARALLAEGGLGTLRVVQVEYPQDWLTVSLEATGQKQAAWRTDPVQSGGGGCIGDIGTHAFNLAEFVTGLHCTQIAADLSSFVEGRRVDDNVNMLLRFSSGARGMLWSSQVAPGHENGLRLRVFGDKAGLEWHQEQPNHLRVTRFGEPPRLVTRNGPGSGPAAAHASRIPAGHPEGYLEGFAQIYSDIAEQVAARIEGREPDSASLLVPTVADGVRGVRFISAAVDSSRNNAAWTALSTH